MTHLTTVILAILLNFPPHVSDAGEPEAEREARVLVASQHIAAAARGIDDMAAMIVLLQFESRGARWVSLGCFGTPPKHMGHCDHGRSLSYWQVKKWGCPKGHALERGSVEQQRVIAGCAARLWRGFFAVCGTLEGAYSAYATGGKCDGLKDAAARAVEHNRVLGMLQRKLSASGVVLAKEKRE